MHDDQLSLPFDEPFSVSDQPGLWTPRDIWVRFTQRMIQHFAEDRRIDYKSSRKIQMDDLAIYLSCFSNTPDGGVLCYGVADNGEVLGCSSLDQKIINWIETCHLQRCPLAKPEFKRVPVIIDGKQDYLIVVYVPYLGKLVETNKSEAWIRYGDTKHKMSEEEKRDFRATRNEVAFEHERANALYPSDFNLSIIQDFCDEFRSREQRQKWSNEEILVDRYLLEKDQGKYYPLNALVLLAGKFPGKTIPGCRVRVQRFDGEKEGSGESYRPIRDRFFEGSVVEIIQKASKYIEDSLHNVTWLNAEGKFVTTPEYPKWAWFESLVNACVHRSYSFSGTDTTIKIFSNRMEIESPGGFVPPVNEKTIYDLRASRNHHFMDAMRYLGYVQMAREGTRRIRDSMAEYNLPEPEFRQEALHGVVVRVTLQNDHEKRNRSSDRDVAVHFGEDQWRLMQEHEIKIAAYAYRNGKIQVSEAQRLTGRTWATSKKDLERLCRKRILEFVPGDYSRDPKAHYKLANEPNR
ncbi:MULTISPECIES: ATP-binding protein [unclassified Yoonia]|uniref:ATP-binding protein n=1 Tax=unclassified Yoonia TaxID=2629118 RepID=UPI002AFDFBBC|nr:MULTISPECIES: ATP-binding protein [unclassified Yoonia]